VLYLANPSTPPVTDLMRAGRLGMICTPKQGNRHIPGVLWAADNGCFSDKWDESEWWQFLEGRAEHRSSCLFAVAPDVVGDAAATAERSGPWLTRIKRLGYPVAYVGQDGATTAPWDQIDAWFIGGSTDWKLGPEARLLAGEAKQRGKWVHMGRVNSWRRYRYAQAIGCDSVDGTFLTFGPNTNLPRLVRWSNLGMQESLL
jgi:hypothetical protein